MKKPIEREDLVKAISGHFKGYSGWVARVSNDLACVVWKGYWDHGIWVDLRDIKLTRKGKKNE